VPAFHSNPVDEDRVAESKSCAGNGAEAQERSQASEQDCADVASRNLPLRNACRVKVGTITRSAQSAISRAVQSIGHAGSAVGRRLTLHVALRESPADESYATPVVLTVSGRRFSPR
jgi:hypothetical protein